jgi:Sigma-70 factor, region 1.1
VFSTDEGKTVVSKLPDERQRAEFRELASDELDDLIAEGLKQGYLALEEMRAVLAELELSPEQTEAVTALCAELGIELLESDRTPFIGPFLMLVP